MILGVYILCKILWSLRYKMATKRKKNKRKNAGEEIYRGKKERRKLHPGLNTFRAPPFVLKILKISV